MRYFLKVVLDRDSIKEAKKANASCVKLVKDYVANLNYDIKIDKGKVEIVDSFGCDKLIGHKWKLKLLNKKEHKKFGWSFNEEKMFFLVEIKAPFRCGKKAIEEYVENIQYNLEINGFYTRLGSYDEWGTDDNFWLGHGWKLECVDSFNCLLMAKIIESGN